MNRNLLRIIGAGAMCAGAALWGCLPNPEADEAGVAATETTVSAERSQTSATDQEMALDPAKMTDEQWRAKLTPEQYRVLREKGTERAFTGAYWDTKDEGVYRCAGCGEALFTSDTKFDSGCGWPSFYQAAQEGKIEEHVDRSHGMVRTEVTCAKCGGHLGHVFEDGPRPTGLRYCINSASIDLEKKDDTKPEAP